MHSRERRTGGSPDVDATCYDSPWKRSSLSAWVQCFLRKKTRTPGPPQTGWVGPTGFYMNQPLFFYGSVHKKKKKQGRDRSRNPRREKGKKKPKYESRRYRGGLTTPPSEEGGESNKRRASTGSFHKDDNCKRGKKDETLAREEKRGLKGWR